MNKSNHRANDSFRSTTGVVGGFAFGLFLVAAVPFMGFVTLGSMFGTVIGLISANDIEASQKSRDIASQTAGWAFVMFFASCALDVGLYKLIKSMR